MKDIKAGVIAFIRKNGDTSFPELEQYFGNEDIEWRGDLSLTWNEFADFLVLWQGWNIEVIKALAGLQSDGVLFFRLMTTIDLFCSGKALNLPIANRVIKYKTPHWLPVMLSLTDTHSLK